APADQPPRACSPFRLGSIRDQAHDEPSMNYRTFGCTTILLALVLSAGCASNPATASPPAPFPGARLPAWQPRTPGGAPGMLAVLETAMALQGAPYRLGGTSPQAGFDCS